MWEGLWPITVFLTTASAIPALMIMTLALAVYRAFQFLGQIFVGHVLVIERRFATITLRRARFLAVTIACASLAFMAMGFSMSFRRPVGMPFLAILVSHDPFSNAPDDLFVGRKHRGFQIDNGEFGNRNFHFISSPTRANCSLPG